VVDVMATRWQEDHALVASFFTSALQWTHRASRDWNTYVATTIAERTTRGLSANTARSR
jgi:hypothetical protein